jgi:hypothetical protein
MRTIFILSALMLIGLTGFGQSFIASGKVTDRQSGMPLAGASVFCQNTTIGTTTNAEGNFQLTLPGGGYDLVISFNGYETFSMRISQGMENIRSIPVEMKVKDKNLEEVAIVATNEVKDGWEKYGALFRDQFLGMTRNSGMCRIENPESLRFLYSRKRDRLKVLAREPLRISNAALGYVIRYELDSFIHEFGSGNTESVGYALFEQMTGSEEEQQLWKTNRENAYYGSMLHFMRCYYDSTLGMNGYKLARVDPRTGKNTTIGDPYDSSIYRSTASGDVQLLNKGKLRVAYTLEQPEKKYLAANKLPENTTIQISILDFPEEIIIEQNGYFHDQKDILSLGYWSWEKLADMLPYDFDPEYLRRHGHSRSKTDMAITGNGQDAYRSSSLPSLSQIFAILFTHTSSRLFSEASTVGVPM